jgi:hypothetical protein
MNTIQLETLTKSQKIALLLHAQTEIEAKRLANNELMTRLHAFSATLAGDSGSQMMAIANQWSSVSNEIEAASAMEIAKIIGVARPDSATVN